MTAARPVSSARSVSAASANAAQTAATNAPATLPTLGLMPPLPGNCCPTFRQNTCKSQSFVFCGKISFSYFFPRAMQAITESWFALEDEEDEEEGEDEEVMRALFEEEEDEDTDVESDGDAFEEVFELF